MRILMKLFKAFLILILIIFFLQGLTLFFVYKDALFSIKERRELSGKIVYHFGGLEGDIAIMELPSGKKTFIPQEVTDYAVRPSCSPDGKKIIFQGRRDILYMINADGTELEEFFNFRRIGKYASWDVAPGAYAPSWSHNGEKVAFISEKGLHITDVDSSYAFRKILDICLAKCQPAWSPDSKRIAVVSDERIREPIKPGWYSEIFAGRILIVNIDGTGLRVLIGGTDPSWSPNGKKIAYKAEDGYYIIDADDYDGSTKELIFSTKDSINTGVFIPPRWSPDGKYITVGKKRFYYDDGVYVVPIDNPKKPIWLNIHCEYINGMSWVK